MILRTLLISGAILWAMVGCDSGSVPAEPEELAQPPDSRATAVGESIAVVPDEEHASDVGP
jgi:hypothetical protein